MRGFTHYGLLIFPNPDSYENRQDYYKILMGRTMEKLTKYMSHIDIQLRCFATDETSLLVNPPSVEWLQTLPDADMFFMKSNNESMLALDSKQLVKVDELYSKAMTKHPAVRGLDTEQRFQLACKRESLITKELLDNSKLNIFIRQSNNMPYTINIKDKPTLTILIDSKTFIPTCYMGDNVINPNELLGFTGANRAVYEWEEDKWQTL